MVTQRAAATCRLTPTLAFETPSLVRALGVSLVVLATLASPATARAAPGQGGPADDEARVLFEEGLALEKRGDHEAALEKFVGAAKRRPTPGVRFHEAYCLEMTGRLAAALRAYEAAEVAARAHGKPEPLRAVQDRLSALKMRVPRLVLRLSAPPPDEAASLEVDGAPASLAALLEAAPVFVDPGAHEIIARSQSGRVASAHIDVAEGDAKDVELRFAVAAPEGPPPMTARASVAGASTAARAPERSRVLPFATAGGALVLAAGGVGSFLAAGAAQGDARDACRARFTCDDERRRVRTLDALALAGFVAGAGLGVLSVVLFTRGPSAQATSAAPASVRLVALPGGFVVQGSL